MPILLALVSSVSWGTSDFIGGFVSKRYHYLVVSFWRSVAENVLLLAPILLMNATFSWDAVMWGSLGGLIGGCVGLPMFYRALSEGRMGVVAPVTGTVGALVPLIVGLIQGERPSNVQLIGAAVAITAIFLVSTSTGTDEAGDRLHIHEMLRQRDLHLAVLCGLCFGAFFALMDHAPENSGLWPNISSTIVSMFVTGLAVVFIHGRMHMERRHMVINTIGAAFDGLSSASFVFATRMGLLSVVGVVGSMYPVVTVVLAVLVLKEKLTLLHASGLAAALASFVLIGLG